MIGMAVIVFGVDAASYITRLPKAEYESPQCQAAIEALIMAAEGRGPLMHAASCGR